MIKIFMRGGEILKRNLKIITMACIVTMSLSGCTNYEFKGKVDAECIDKNYRSSYTYYVPIIIGKIMTLQPRFMPEQYNTTLEYENMVRVVNDKELYDNIEISEYVEVDYYESENGEHRKIIYPKDNNNEN